LYDKKINLSVSLAGQAVGVKEVDPGIWLVSFMDYVLDYIDLEEKSWQPFAEPLRAKSVTQVSGTFCYPCLRNGQVGWLRGVDLNHRPLGYESEKALWNHRLAGTDGLCGSRFIPQGW
jgi:hypothetical protein